MSDESREIVALEFHSIYEHEGRTGFFFRGRDGSNREREYVVTLCESGVAKLAEKLRQWADYKKSEAQRAWNRAVTLDKRLKGEE